MSKQNLFIGGMVLALIVLAVFVYNFNQNLNSLEQQDRALGQAVSSVIGIGGPPSVFSEIELADGEYLFGGRHLEMSTATGTNSTSTLMFDNRSGGDLIIRNIHLSIPSNERATSTFRWMVATTTFSLDGNDEASGSSVTLLSPAIMQWRTATGSSATSTSMFSDITGDGTTASANLISRSPFSFVLRNNERILLRLYHEASITGTGPGPGCNNGTGCQNATSSDRGFSPVMEIEYGDIP